MTVSSRRRQSILVDIELSQYGLQLLRGLTAAPVARDWDLVLQAVGEAGSTDPASQRWQIDAVVSQVRDPAQAARLQYLGRPVVNLSGSPVGRVFPTVDVDRRAIGALAARHFTERGFIRFAVCVDHPLVQTVAADGFTVALQGAGYPVADLRLTRDETPDLVASRLRDWVRQLPGGTAIFCPYDGTARRVAAACLQQGIAVPEELAILGSDDDPVLCGLSTPPLSSIALPGETIGRLAADLLQRLLAGRPPTSACQLVPPAGVTVRRSSDATRSDDPLVAAALAIMVDTQGVLTQADIARRLHVSVRTLQRRFQTVLQTGVMQHHRLITHSRARQLLRQQDRSLAEIASRCGFRSPRQLADSFRRLEGMTVAEYRRLVAGRSPGPDPADAISSRSGTDCR